jgi:paraquat-inducible protein B
MGKHFSPTLVGLFVVGAIALAVVGVAVFGSGQFFRETERYVVFFQGSVNGLRTGAPVKIKGVQIGEVIEIRLGIGDVQLLGMDPPRIPVVIELDLDSIRSQGATGDARQTNLQRLLDEGLRAQLSTESFVTGILYVALDFFPETPIDLVGGEDLPYPELPAIPTTLEQAQTAAAEIISKLREMKLDEMIEDLRQAAHGVNELVNSEGLKQGADSLGEVMAGAKEALVDVSAAVERVEELAGNLDSSLTSAQKELASTTKEARQTFAAATESLQNVRSLTRPEAPLAQQMTETLKDLSLASRRLSNFLDYLERNPSALLRGKSAPESE